MAEHIREYNIPRPGQDNSQWSLSSEFAHIDRLGNGVMCVKGAIQATRLTLLNRYKGALKNRVWEGMDNINDNLEALDKYLDIAIEREERQVRA